MTNKTSQKFFIKFIDGSTTYYLPISSSLRRAVVETVDNEEDTSTSSDYPPPYLRRQFSTILHNQKQEYERKPFHSTKMKFAY